MTVSFVGEDYLEIRDLTVDFDGFKAIDGVDLNFLQGRLHFLIGPNGAGKTTLVDALTGLVQGTGEATFRRNNLLGMKSHEIVRLGIGRTFQTATVFEQLSVVQNLDIAAGVHRKATGRLRARRKVPEIVEQTLETIGLTARGSTGRVPGPRAEAVARGRHAPGARRPGDVPRRDGRGDEQRGAGGDR